MDADITYVFLFISLYFEVFMLMSFLERRTRSAVAASAGVLDDAQLPTAAIVVPCFNEEKSIASTIASLLKVDYPAGKFEIIVVDDGSTDGTLAIARRFESDPAAGMAGLRVRVFHKENGGKHTAMNFALTKTTADLIGCLDADSVVAPSAMRRIAEVFQNPEVAAVTPGIFVKKPETVLQYMQEAEYRLSVFNRFTLASLGSAFITPGPFSIFRTKVVREEGGWRHGHSTEDMEMALRMQNAGYLIGNAPGAVVYTGTPRTIRGLFRQRVRWTYGFLRNAVDYRHMFGNGDYGTLGLLILPTALASIAIAIYFFARILYYAAFDLVHLVTRFEVLGFSFHPSFSLFYINTSAMWFLIYAAVVLVVGLISVGTFIGSGKRLPPIGTPLFVLFYSFLVPLWLGTAVVRAVFKTGVRWR
jgi:cellulose synthase/poly-beta-1,6-N-acetylglucosamine synthase-like glycosyltransferase